MEIQKPGQDGTEKTSLLRDTRGLTTVEYIIILCLIAIVGFVAWKKFGTAVAARTDEAATTVEGLSGTGGGAGGGH